MCTCSTCGINSRPFESMDSTSCDSKTSERIASVLNIYRLFLLLSPLKVQCKNHTYKIYIIWYIISNLKVIQRIWEHACGLYANTVV